MDGLIAALFIVGSVVIAAMGTIIVHRHLPLDEAHNNVAGFIYSVIGVVYAVLLAFVVLVVWEQFDTAQSDSAAEAGLLSDVYRDAWVLPAPVDAEMRAGIVLYVDAVKKEWPALARGEGTIEAQLALRELWRIMSGYEPATASQSAWYGEMLTRLNDVAEARQQRLHSARSTMPLALWAVLILGALVTIGFSYLFGSLPTRIHATMIGALTAVIACVMVLIASLDRPFRGITAIDHDAFDQLETVFEVWKGK